MRKPGQSGAGGRLVINANGNVALNYTIFALNQGENGNAEAGARLSVGSAFNSLPIQLASTKIAWSGCKTLPCAAPIDPVKVACAHGTFQVNDYVCQTCGKVPVEMT
jgi:hypothetical protein